MNKLITEEKQRWNDTLTRVINRVISEHIGATKVKVMQAVYDELSQAFDSHPDDPTIRINEKKIDGFRVMVTLDKVGKLTMDFKVKLDVANKTTA